MNNNPQEEERKEVWTPCFFLEDWEAFKKVMKRKGYKQNRLVNSSKLSRMIYSCKFDILCNSQYEVTKYTDYYDVLYNETEHLGSCQALLDKETQMLNMVKAKAKPSNIAKTLNLQDDKKQIKALYNLNQQIKKEETNIEQDKVYDRDGLEKWAKERYYTSDQLLNLNPSTIFVSSYDLGSDFYYIVFTCFDLTAMR